MPDIYFKCYACGKHLVVDSEGIGVTINCPDCKASVRIPTIVDSTFCQCGEKINISRNLYDQPIPCPVCKRDVILRAPSKGSSPE
jgi:predicted RNA-binding Zn-ribbon protein involved in translation (DUF1610 family)